MLKYTGSGKWKRVGTPEEGFVYLGTGGRPIRGDHTLRRIRALAIPPAWTGVEIDPDPAASIQAVGTDAAGRRQYRYHSEFVSLRARRKFRRLLPFARAIPRFRGATSHDLRGDELSRERVLATLVRLMYRAFFRVGSERYAIRNQTFGIATLEKRHLTISGSNLIFRYIGKSSVEQLRVVAETPLVEIVEQILTLPGDRLFRYRDSDGIVRDVTAPEVNRYLAEVFGEPCTSKDIRTWGGTLRAATVLSDLGPALSSREALRNLTLTCKLVSTDLGNTPTVCRGAYIHPAVLDRYLLGDTIDLTERKGSRPARSSDKKYYPEEVALMRFLEEVEESGE
ncbi:MAG: DNA topoisomerase IB [Gemmatimonadota bacterium]|jgi:DNA topoisomerase-1|nr:DNA topoisomerase IB [Gemmatimonadota bacterium]